MKSYTTLHPAAPLLSTWLKEKRHPTGKVGSTLPCPGWAGALNTQTHHLHQEWGVQQWPSELHSVPTHKTCRTTCAPEKHLTALCPRSFCQFLLSALKFILSPSCLLCQKHQPSLFLPMWLATFLQSLSVDRPLWTTPHIPVTHSSTIIFPLTCFHYLYSIYRHLPSVCLDAFPLGTHISHFMN